MSETDVQIKKIFEKVQSLLKQRDALKKENEQFREQLLQVKEAYIQATSRLEQMQQQIDILRVSRTDMGMEEKKALEKRLNQYIREIDRCITFVRE